MAAPKKGKQEVSVPDQIVGIVNKLAKRRLDKQITTYQMETLTGIKQGNITRIESHKTKPSLNTLLRLANVLEMQVELTEA